MTENQKAVFITGASTGIGWETTKTLSEKGYLVFAGARKKEDLERIAALPNVVAVELDVTNSEQVAKIAEVVREKLAGKPLYALINNAGIVKAGPWESIPMEDIRYQFDVNVFGLLAVTRALLPFIRESKGRIINISSISGKVATGFLGPYSASKFAVEAITDSLRREMRPFNVKVVSINPGPIDTEIWKKKDGAFSPNGISEEQLKLYEKYLKKFEVETNKAAKRAEPVELVVKDILHGLESNCPKTRYFVGKGIKAAALMMRILPDKLQDKII